MSVRWSEGSLREAVADIAADAIPSTYAHRVADAAEDYGIPAAVIDNRFRSERGAPEKVLQRNAIVQALRVHATQAANDLPEEAYEAWSPAAGSVVELGGETLAFVGYEPYGALLLIGIANSVIRLEHGDPRIEHVMKQVSSAFRAKLVAER